mmetsp:Transcript_1712/g.6285  ORF Transcript_1712/g.6285 Transcript_1712/m.6285 type:complete len:305 (+) Transcript_1712:2013-2927(+)
MSAATRWSASPSSMAESGLRVISRRPDQGPTRTSRSSRSVMLCRVGTAAAATTPSTVDTGQTRPPKAEETPTTRSPTAMRLLSDADPDRRMAATTGPAAVALSVRPSGLVSVTSQASRTDCRSRMSRSDASQSSSDRRMRSDTVVSLPSVASCCAMSRDRTADSMPSMVVLGHMASPTVADVATTASPTRQPATAAPPPASSAWTRTPPGDCTSVMPSGARSLTSKEMVFATRSSTTLTASAGSAPVAAARPGRRLPMDRPRAARCRGDAFGASQPMTETLTTASATATHRRNTIETGHESAVV